MKKAIGTLLLLAIFAISGLNASAQTIPGLPTKTIADVAGTSTSLTKKVGDIVGGLTGEQQKSTGTALTSLLNGLNKDVIPKQFTNAAAALTAFNGLKEKFNKSMSTILGAAKLAKLAGGNANGATGAILSMLSKK